MSARASDASRPAGDIGAQTRDGGARTGGTSACLECLRRCWLLGTLNGRLEYAGRDADRLAALLDLSDIDLIEAVGGGKRERLLDEYANARSNSGAKSDPGGEPAPGGEPGLRAGPRSRAGHGREANPQARAEVNVVERICRHHPRFPRALARGPGAPRLLHVAGGLARASELLLAPTVAIVGARAASDYGLEVAHGLGRGLAASGVTVVSGLADGIASAALAGALEVAGPTVTVAAGGIDVCHPASRRALYRRLHTDGCVLAELPCGTRPRTWCHTARARIVVALARVVVVVEARERPAELLHARLARETGRVLAAIPGRLGSPLSRGPHALLREGARLVRGPEDVLDALYSVGERSAAPAATRETRPACETAPVIGPSTRAVLDAVGAGRDTIGKLLASGAPEQETLLALAKLELSDTLVRGDAGRYLPNTV